VGRVLSSLAAQVAYRRSESANEQPPPPFGLAT